MVSDPDGGHHSRMRERRVFLFEQLVIFSEPLEKKKGSSLPGFLYKNSIKVTKHTGGIAAMWVQVYTPPPGGQKEILTKGGTIFSLGNKINVADFQ